MTEIIAALLCIIVGLALCFRGYLTMRVIIPIWGAFIGFFLGVGLVAAATGDGVLSTALGWIVGVVLALFFGYIAYAYFAVSVVISLAGIGFALGASLMIGLHVDWTWLIVAGGVLVGIVLAWLAIAFDLPMLVLVVATAAGGASSIVAGVMLLTGAIDVSDLDRSDVVSRIDASPLWSIAVLVLAVVGAVTQQRTVQDGRRLRQRFDG